LIGYFLLVDDNKNSNRPITQFNIIFTALKSNHYMRCMLGILQDRFTELSSLYVPLVFQPAIRKSQTWYAVRRETYWR